MAEPNLLREPILDWFAENARDLPWRRPDADPWGVLVSEIMLQQTPVVRVTPAWHAWMNRWPTPAALAEDPPSEAIRMWGRLGYPRRALRLHECAVAIADRHGGQVPADLDALLALPGIGPWTVAYIRMRALGDRDAFLPTDLGVRRALARLGHDTSPRAITALAERWRPFRAYAVQYLWG